MPTPAQPAPGPAHPQPGDHCAAPVPAPRQRAHGSPESAPLPASTPQHRGARTRTPHITTPSIRHILVPSLPWHSSIPQPKLQCHSSTPQPASASHPASSLQIPFDPLPHSCPEGPCSLASCSVLHVTCPPYPGVPHTMLPHHLPPYRGAALDEGQAVLLEVHLPIGYCSL